MLYFLLNKWIHYRYKKQISDFLTLNKALILNKQMEDFECLYQFCSTFHCNAVRLWCFWSLIIDMIQLFSSYDIGIVRPSLFQQSFVAFTKHNWLFNWFSLSCLTFNKLANPSKEDKAGLVSQYEKYGLLSSYLHL